MRYSNTRPVARVTLFPSIFILSSTEPHYMNLESGKVDVWLGSATDTYNFASTIFDFKTTGRVNFSHEIVSFITDRRLTMQNRSRPLLWSTAYCNPVNRQHGTRCSHQ
ncbi:hypothetical protein CY34DRAFT_556498 [Suillus luteus UH-Slu-Lm8-n1]|uniref:Uncharacterized protein n=1 Tax=Suillus luteus UH-Slu-Lm8-n1 TaxID=930992 RepID=A0A0D0A554_9AGAM|nr:hypothetical protein CY34DRAFT_556498 [Suillus luteus UH-Slu-Lm8-n1]